MIQEEFSVVLRQRRKAKGLTQQGLAEASDLSLRYIQELEAGKKQPSLKTLFLLSYGLGTNPQQLISNVWLKWRKGIETNHSTD
ncbi:MAG: helix-turn-helix transcriptional regulator [Candidatus Thiodiazotropha sp. L084R]